MKNIKKTYYHNNIYIKTQGNLIDYWQGDIHMSRMYLGDNGRIDGCGYVNHIAKNITDEQKGRKSKVVVIGCAGGVLGTMLEARGCLITMVDIDPNSFKIAKAHFRLPETVQCVTGCGARIIGELNTRMDYIVLDAFDNSGAIPRVFKTKKFIQDCIEKQKATLIINCCSKVDIHVYLGIALTLGLSFGVKRIDLNYVLHLSKINTTEKENNLCHLN